MATDRFARRSNGWLFGVWIPLFAMAISCAPRTQTDPLDTPPANETSVKPGINQQYENPDVPKVLERLETESREIYRDREAIVRDLRLKPGTRLADIGAGTGLFTELLGNAVGEHGKVFAVDISQQLLDYIAQRAAKAGLRNVETVLCQPKTVNLPAGSIDAAFICDVYHHFEYPRSSMASLHKAMRPGGTLYLIDFVRIEGVTRQWVLDHVRAGQEVFTSEIEAAGFEQIKDFHPTAPLSENYFIAFRRK